MKHGRNPNTIPMTNPFDPAILRFLEGLLARRRKADVLRLLSTSDTTLDNLMVLGRGSLLARDRIERYTRGLMRSEGLIPPPERVAAVPRPKPVRELLNDQGDFRALRSERSVDEHEGVRIGQLWLITEPCGREVRVRVSRIVLDPIRGARAVGRTPSGKLRRVHVPRLAAGRHARLLEDAPPATEARSA